jgi:hypothetical protein
MNEYGGLPIFSDRSSLLGHVIRVPFWPIYGFVVWMENTHNELAVNLISGILGGLLLPPALLLLAPSSTTLHTVGLAVLAAFFYGAIGLITDGEWRSPRGPNGNVRNRSFLPS